MAEIAALGLKVDASGVQNATDSLRDFVDKGSKAEKSIQSVGKSLEEIGKSGGRAAAGLESVSSATSGASKGVSSLGDSAKTAQQTIKEMQAAMTAAVSTIQTLSQAQAEAAKSAQTTAKSFSDVSKQITLFGTSAAKASEDNLRIAKSMDVASTAAGALKTALAVAGVGFGAQELFSMIDGYTKYSAQLKLATKSQTEQAVAMSSVSRIATEAQAGIGELATLYARIANATSEMGISQRKVADITETVALALKANGATASETSSAMLQLSQAFGSGVLRGEEFNAVYEAAPNLLRELAVAMGKPIGSLREMASEGKLTSAVLAEYLPMSLSKFREQAAEVQTISGAFTVLKNNVMEAIGEQAKSSGATNALTTSIKALSDNIDTAAVSVTALGAVFGVRLLVPVAATTAAFVAQQAAVIQAAAAIAGASVTSTAAMASMTVASRALSAAGSFLLGPWGAAIALVGSGVAAFYAFGDSTSKLVKDIGGLNQPLDDLKKKIDALPPEKRIAIVIDIKEEAEKKAKQAAASFDDLASSVVGAFSGARAASKDSAQQVNDLVSKLEDAKKTGSDMTPILQAAAKAASVSGSTLKTWLDLAANIREATAAAQAGQVAEISGGGAGRGSINPKTAAEIAKERAAAEQKLIDVRMRAAGINKQYFTDLATYEDALAKGVISREKYIEEVSNLAKKTYESSTAGKEAAKQSRENASASKKEQTAYASLSASIAEKISINKSELEYSGRLNDAQKAEIKLNEDLKTGKLKLTASDEARIRSSIAVWKEQEKAKEQVKRNVELYKEQVEIDKEIIAAEARRVAAINAMQETLRGYNQYVSDSVALTKLEYETLGMNSVARSTLIEQMRIEFEWRDRIEKIKKSDAFASNAERDAAIAEAESLRDKAKANAQTKAYVSEWEKAYDQSSQALTDALMKGGKNAGEYLTDYFRTLVFTPIVKAIVQPVAGSIASTVTSSLGFGGGASDASGVASNVGLLSNLTGAVGAGVKAGLSGWAGTLGLSGTGTTVGGSLSAGFTALGAGNIAGGLGTLLGVAGPVLGGISLISSLMGGFGSRGANHMGAAYSTSVTGNNAAAAQLFGTSSGDWYGDLTSRYSAEVGTQLGKSVEALSGVYKSLAKYAGDSAKQIDIVAGFAANSAYADESAYGYFKLIDKISGTVLKDYTARDNVLSTDPAKAYEQFIAEMGVSLIDQIKSADIPGWMKSIFDTLGTEVTFDGINQALQAITAIDKAFTGWADTLHGFANLSAEAQTALLNTSGGLDALSGNISNFYAGFYTEQERMATLQRQVLDQLSSLDVSIDTSTAEKAKASFRSAVENALAAGNAELAAKLLALSGSFATAADYAAKASETISQAMQGLMDDRRQLEADLLKAQGKTKEYAAAIRAIAIEGYTPAEIAAYDYNQALRDQIDALDAAAEKQNQIASERSSLETQLLGLLGNTSELRARELAALDASNRAIQEHIWAIEDAQAAYTTATAAAQEAYSGLEKSVSAQKSVLQEQYNAQKTALQEQANAAKEAWQAQLSSAQNAASEMRSIATMLGNAFDSVQVDTPALSRTRLASAQSLIVGARNSNNVRAAGLEDALKIASGDTAKMYGKWEEWAFQQGVTAGAVGDLYSEAQKQLSAQEQIIAQLQASDAVAQAISNAETEKLDSWYQQQLSVLDSTLETGKSQLNALLGINDGVLSVADAVAKLGLSINAAESARQSAEAARASAAAYASTGGGGSAAVNTSVSYTDEQLRAMGLDPSAVNSQYNWLKSNGATNATGPGELVQGMITSGQAALQGVLNTQTNTDKFGNVYSNYADFLSKFTDAQIISASQIAAMPNGPEKDAALQKILDASINGSHAAGLARVPFDGYIAELHKDERVLTASEARAYQPMQSELNTTPGGAGWSPSQVQDMMYEELRKITEAARAGAISSGAINRKLERVVREDSIAVTQESA